MSWKHCPECGHEGTKVADTRWKDGEVVRRYRCKKDETHRWSTLEVRTEKAYPHDPFVQFQGESMRISQWAERLGLSPTGMRSRLATMPIEAALTLPRGHKKRSIMKMLPRSQS